jgi:tRNA(Ile)-lysidine synthase
MSLVSQVEGAVRDFDLLRSGDKVLVAVSGGADSTCLLFVLHGLSRRLGIRLRAFHLNHRLRGRAADLDERQVAARCRRLNVPVTILRTNVLEFARKHRLSVEEAGRNLRYQLLEQVAGLTGCSRIATAHNANDNAETVLMNLARGSGLTGLSGIPVRRGAIVRPLIRVERSEIERYLAERRIRFRDDLSNLRLEHSRNLVRHRLVPVLRSLNPRVIQTISRASELLRAEDDWLAGQAAEKVRQVALPVPGGWRLDTASLMKYNICLQRRVLKALVPELSFDDVTTALNVAAGRVGGRRELGDRVMVWKEREGLFLGRVPEPPSSSGSLLRVPGRNRLPEFRVRMDIVTEERRPVPARNGSEVFDLDEVRLPLFVRTRRPGDRFAPFGGRTRKLQDILVDDRIPRRERDHLPLLCDQQGILWAIGSRRASRARVTEVTRRFMTVSCVPISACRGDA